jgi:manganese transport protein
MVPAFVAVELGIDATRALILSHVVLSLILPVPMIALLTLTGRDNVMGSCANGRITMAAATAAAAIVLGLNLLLVLQIAGLPLPGFAAAGWQMGRLAKVYRARRRIDRSRANESVALALALMPKTD